MVSIAAISAKRFLEIGMEETAFLFGCFAGADDPRDAFAVGVDDREDDDGPDKAEADFPELGDFARINTGEDWPREDLRGFFKSDPVLAEVGFVFLIVPFKRHARSLCIYRCVFAPVRQVSLAGRALGRRAGLVALTDPCQIRARYPAQP
jgi:hypothetical protein